MPTVPPMMPTRPCCHCLNLHDGCVFADFDVNEDGLIYLRRISFDGYGCCGIEAPRLMNEEDSRTLIEWIEANDVDHDAAHELLARYFSQHKDIIWPDALAEYDLLR